MNKSDEMHVIKRNGKSEDISFDKILQRVRKLGLQFNLNIPYSLLVMKVIDQLYNNITTEQIDILTAEQCTSMSTIHPDYSTLAALISISNLHKKTNKSFYNTMKQAYEFKDINGKDSPIINHNAWNIIQNNKDLFDNLIDHNKDYLIDYFGFKTLERAYLIKVNNKIIERPQYMFLRVAICIHGNNIEKVKETYKFMSEKWFTHATPTLFNACTRENN
jgi:ribonucleotide reductase alpha subunit